MLILGRGAGWAGRQDSRPRNAGSARFQYD
jgi:hypothetical protein